MDQNTAEVITFAIIVAAGCFLAWLIFRD